MPSDTIGLGLDGAVSLHRYAYALRQYMSMLRALTEEVGQGATIIWQIDELGGCPRIMTANRLGSGEACRF